MLTLICNFVYLTYQPIFAVLSLLRQGDSCKLYASKSPRCQFGFSENFYERLCAVLVNLDFRKTFMSDSVRC